MRSKLKILWLDDDLKSDAHNSRVSDITDYLKNKGYIADFKFFSDYNEALKRLNDKSKRTDFFVTDFNLSDDENRTGLDYLIEIRQSDKKYKQFVILYSQKPYNNIKEEVLKKFGAGDLKNLNNFSFISLSTGDILDFQEAIAVVLSRWDELNAIRGRYMMVCSDMHHKLKIKFTCENSDFFSCIGRITNDEELKNGLNKMRSYRNALAHTIEEYDGSKKCFYIRSTLNSSIILYENEIDTYKKELLEVDNRLSVWLECN